MFDFLAEKGNRMKRKNKAIWAITPVLAIPERVHHLIQRLTRLRRQGHKLFLLSNTNALHWEQIARNIEQIEGKRVEEYFDRVFLSYEMHRCKPDKDIFVQMLQEAGLQACDTLFFDDSADNCAAARSVGIDAVLVERNSKWGDILLKD